MGRKLTVMWAAVAAVLAAGQVPVMADSFTANVPFEFHAGRQVLPAGTYVVSFSRGSAKVLTIKAQNGAAAATVPIITRLALRDKGSTEAHLVFDRVEGELTVAEFWAPGTDGFYLGGGLVSHTHVIVTAK